MITFACFLLMITGGINWLLIGFLQYDFIAGFFGFQASIFSRICYIIFGLATAYVVVRTIANKGKMPAYERRKKQKQSNQNTLQDTVQDANLSPKISAAETSKEFVTPEEYRKHKL